MGEVTDADIDAALERGCIASQTEPRASSARYDAASGRVIVELTNGCVFAFPPRLAQGLGRRLTSNWRPSRSSDEATACIGRISTSISPCRVLWPGCLERAPTWLVAPVARRLPPRPKPRGRTAPRADARAREPKGALRSPSVPRRARRPRRWRRCIDPTGRLDAGRRLQHVLADLRGDARSSSPCPPRLRPLSDLSEDGSPEGEGLLPVLLGECEPRRVSRRLFCLSHAAMACSSVCAL